jgi:hypothetical protein
MRITLERSDLISLLSKALNYQIADGDVEIQADPFEVHIRSMRLDELASPTPVPPAGAASSTKTPTTPVQENISRPELSMEELEEENARILGFNESYDPPGIEDP